MRSHRRGVLRATLAGGALIVLDAHTPYQQWQVYRQKHLLIGTSKADAPTYPLGQRIAALLAERLPASRARVTRAPDPWRLASLLTTGQLEVVLLGADDARALRVGAAPYEAFGPTELRALYRVGDHWLVVRPDFPDHHAWQVVAALHAAADAFADAGPPSVSDAPALPHLGAMAQLAGHPMPPAPPATEPVSVEHAH